jgi:hypothetical protein
MSHAFLDLLGIFFWLATLAVVSFIAATHLRKSNTPARGQDTVVTLQSDSPRPELSGFWMRDKISRLDTTLALSTYDVDNFASKLLQATPGAFIMRDPDAFKFPCYVVAIPDNGLSFDLRQIAFDPHSEMADLEARILSTATSSLAELALPIPAARATRQRL